MQVSNRRSCRWLNDRLLLELVPCLGAHEIKGLFAPPPWGNQSISQTNKTNSSPPWCNHSSFVCTMYILIYRVHARMLCRWGATPVCILHDKFCCCMGCLQDHRHGCSGMPPYTRIQYIPGPNACMQRYIIVLRCVSLIVGKFLWCLGKLDPISYETILRGSEEQSFGRRRGDCAERLAPY